MGILTIQAKPQSRAHIVPGGWGGILTFGTLTFLLMKYYLLQNGKEYGPYEKPDIMDSTKAGGIPPETQVREETQAEWQPLSTLFPPKPKPAVPAVERIRLPAITMAESAQEHLFRVRNQSSYSELRGFITVVTLIGFLAALLVAIMSAMDKEWLKLAGWAIPVIALPAMRAFLLVFIDIADTLLDASRQR